MKIAIVGAADSVDKIYNTLEKKYTDIDFILKKEGYKSLQTYAFLITKLMRCVAESRCNG